MQELNSKYHVSFIYPYRVIDLSEGKHLHVLLDAASRAHVLRLI